MTDLNSLIDHIREHPDSRQSLLEMIDIFLSPSTTEEERQAIRTVAAEPDVTLAYENLYFEGEGMALPARFVRHMLAALVMTRGFSHPNTGKQILGELRVFGGHHGVDVTAELEAIRTLPGVRRSPRRWRRFLLVNLLLLSLLAMGTLIAQISESSLVFQTILLPLIIVAQLYVLFRFLQR